MRTAAGRDVGDAYLHAGDHWVFVAVPGWTVNTNGGERPSYLVRVTLDDGSSQVLPGGDLKGGDGAWARCCTSIRTVSPQSRWVDQDGTVWCSATI